MSRAASQTTRTIVVVCIALLALGVAIWAWNAAANNPREGWSLAKTSTGIVGLPRSGDRAYHSFTIPNANYIYPIDGQEDRARVMVFGRRTRFGMFAPWHETTDLRMIDLTGTVRDWQTGTSNPTWIPLVQTALADHQQLANAAADPSQREYQQRIIDALNTELAGGYPQRRVIWSALALDAAGVVAHIALLLIALLGIRALIHYGVAEDRSNKGLCPKCGYPIRGLSGPCPECGCQRAQLRPHWTPPATEYTHDDPTNR